MKFNKYKQVVRITLYGLMVYIMVMKVLYKLNHLILGHLHMLIWLVIKLDVYDAKQIIRSKWC
jgi:hypothetical protein